MRSKPAEIRLCACLVAAMVSGSLSTAAETPANHWPQWRGPTRDSRIAEGTAWPEDLSSVKQRWRVELGPGYSGPIVWDDRVFVTETLGEKDEVVRALDRTTGRELWRATWPGAMSVPFFARDNGSWIRATPACDGESLFVAGMRDVVVCLDSRTGAERWRADFPAKLGTAVPAFGFVSSPLVIGDHVYVQAGAGFVKLDKRSGEVLWRTLADSGAMDSVFSSPVEAIIHGVPQLVVQMREKLAGIVPASGEELWSQVVPSYRGMNILTPTIFENGIFTSTHKNKTFFYRVEKGESAMRVSEAWTSPGQGYMSSPIILDGFAYLHLGNGRVSCIELKTGKETWRSKPFGRYWSSVTDGRRILALDEKGELVLITADPKEFRLLDRKEVSASEAWAHLAAPRNELFVRDLGGVTAFDWAAHAASE